MMKEIVDEIFSIYNAGKADHSSSELNEDPIESKNIRENYFQSDGILKTLKGFAKWGEISKGIATMSELEPYFPNQVLWTNTRETLFDFFQATWKICMFSILLNVISCFITSIYV